MTTDDTPIKIMMVPGGKVPVQATPGSAAYDLFARAVRFNSETRTLECDLGVRVEIPEGWCGLLLPRSSVLRHGLMMANSVGFHGDMVRGGRPLRPDHVHPRAGDAVGGGGQAVGHCQRGGRPWKHRHTIAPGARWP